MGTFSIWHWIIVLVIVVLVFGTKKLRNLGSDLGGALKGFKEGMKESETETPPSRSNPVNESTIEVTASKETFANTSLKESKPATETENNSSRPTSFNDQAADAEFKEKTHTKT